MKRYGLNEFGQLDSESQAGGDYVLFTDAQADKHAALKELAAEVLPFVSQYTFGYKAAEALRKKLLALTERQL